MKQARNVLITAVFIALLYCGSFLGGCSNETGAGNTTPIASPGRADFSSLSMTAAFDAMHQKMSQQYAFTQWRKIDWDSLYSEYRPQVEQARADNDQAAFYLALRNYLYSIHDTHVELFGDNQGTRQAAISGSFGLVIDETDDGEILAVYVTPGGPADAAGIRVGARIDTWNGMDITAAVEQQSYLWWMNPATTVSINLARRALLTRAPLGTSITVGYTNEGGTPAIATLTAVDDSWETYKLSYHFLGPVQFNPDGDPKVASPQVEHYILPSGYGYLGLHAISAESYQNFIVGLQDLIDSDVPGIVLDIRENGGGDDEIAARMVGHFSTSSSFYEYTTIFDMNTGLFRIENPMGTFVTPNKPAFHRPVVAMVSPYNISSGEGVALGVSRLPQGRVVSFYGTAGAFGMVQEGSMIIMPGRLLVMFPVGQSLDRMGQVQLDSDFTGAGGVLPQVRVAKSRQNLIDSVNGIDVQLRQAELELDNLRAGNR